MVAATTVFDLGVPMRAYVVPASGQPPVLTDLPTPVPGPGEVLLRVSAAGLNPFDNHIAAGLLEQFMEHRYPLVLGRDASGVIEAVGEGVEDVAVGDEVLAHVPFTSPFEAGTLADHAILPAAGVAAKPQGLSFVSAAALPLAAGAALALVEGVDPRPGQVVLVNGASGGVGRFAVQLLAQRGVRVVATASPVSAERMRELGAADVVDYTLGTVADQVRSLHPDGVDALINLNGWTLEDVPVEAVRHGGVVRTVTQVPDDATLAARGLTGGQVMASPDREALGPLAAQAASGALQVDVSRVLALGDVPAGYADIEAGRAHGKLVVDLTR
jgi:NADPH:quinone reductase-like Zn-dependent oxidoreductase